MVALMRCCILREARQDMKRQPACSSWGAIATLLYSARESGRKIVLGGKLF